MSDFEMTEKENQMTHPNNKCKAIDQVKIYVYMFDMLAIC